MSRPEAFVAAALPAGEGRSVRKSKTSCLVEQRLAWLGSNWDGTLPPPKLSLPAPGEKPVFAGRRSTNGVNKCVEQAPGYDGHVPGGIRLAVEETTAAAAANKTRRGRSHGTTRDECSSTGTSGGSATDISTKHDVVSGTYLTDNEKPVTDTAAASVQNAADQPVDGRLRSRYSRKDYWSAAHDDTTSCSELEEGREGDLALCDNDDDTAAGDGISIESFGGRGGGWSGSAHDAARDSRADRRENGEGNLPGTTGGGDDTVSELSFSGFHAGLGSIGDSQESEEHLRVDGAAHDSSSESPDQAQPAIPRRNDDDDIDAGHVTHLLDERRRWKLRAFESEHELRSLNASLERRSTAEEVVGRRPVAPTKNEDLPATEQEPGSFGESMSSEVSAAESGFELDDHRWQTTSESESSPAADSASGSSSSAVRSRGETRPVEVLEAASQVWGSEPAPEKPDRSPANAAPRLDDGAAGANDACSDRPVSGDGGLRVLCSDEPGEDGADAHRRLRREFDQLKEKLRETELRHAAAEATAVSNLQRARAAEMSRDVKEIQIRNLEIRLARYTKNGKSYKEACPQWRERQHSSGNERADGGIKLDLFRSNVEQRLLPVAEEPGEEQSWPHESIRNDGGCPPMVTAAENASGPQKPTSSVLNACSENIGGGGGGASAGGGGRAALDQFRHRCAILGAKAARAGGTISAATAVASEAARDAVQSATAAVRAGTARAGGERKATDEIDGRGVVEGYWGSDYLHLGVS